MHFPSSRALSSALIAVVALLAVVPYAIAQNHTDEESESQIKGKCLFWDGVLRWNCCWYWWSIPCG